MGVKTVKIPLGGCEVSVEELVFESGGGLA